MTIERLVFVLLTKTTPKIMRSHRTEQSSHQRSPWRSLGQLAESWGLSRARTNLVVKALVRSGRMEERTARESEPIDRHYRLVR